MFKHIAHIGIAVRDMKSSEDLFHKLFGKPPGDRDVIADQRVNTAIFQIGSGGIELLEATSANSTIALFIEKRGEGIHHISFLVDDIVKELERLKGQGFELIDEKPRAGAEDCLVAFLHPKSTNGVLVELCQKKGDGR